jgi:hypothetical protein
MTDHPAHSSLTRRAVLGGIGAATGLAVGGFTPRPAHADQGLPDGTLGSLLAPATALKPTLRYVVACGHDLAPLESPSAYTTVDGRFRFTGTSSGFASLLANLPVGSVIKEIEMYGTRGAAGLVSLELWKSDVSAGTVTQTASAVVPAVAGEFTVTAAADDLQDARIKSTPFVLIDATAAPTTQIYGMRIGYVSPTGFVPLPTTTSPRVHDSRDAGLTKLAPNEERTLGLPVPAGIGGVVFTLTVTNTEGNGGFVSVYPAGIPWPGNSSINWSGPNQNIANTVVSAVSASSAIVLRGGANRTDVVVDVAGWIA